MKKRRKVEIIRPELDLGEHPLLHAAGFSEVERAINQTLIFDARCADAGTARELFKLLPRLLLLSEVWKTHFLEYGCLSCHRKKVDYASGGLCNRCYARTRNRIHRWFGELIDRNAMERSEVMTSITRKFDAAQRLFGEKEEKSCE